MSNNTLTKEYIVEKMNSDFKWLKQAILAIYARQTEDEKDSETTNNDNGRGFTGTDARFGSSLAKQLLSGRTLSDRQLVSARRMMKKYAGQLLRVVKEKREAAAQVIKGAKKATGWHACKRVSSWDNDYYDD